MTYFKYIFFLVINFTFCFGISLSYLNSKDSIDKKAILIPDYHNNKSKFDFEYLGKSRKVFYHSNIDYLNKNKAIRLSFSPYFNHSKIKFKIDLEHFLNLEESSLLINDWSPIGIIEKIDYLELQLFDERLNLFLGEISDLTFGHGYLLNKYGNNYNYPIDKNVGIKLKIRNSNNSILYTSFISNLDHFLESGGLIGNHLSFLISDSFPIRIGFGHIVDLDQFVSFKNHIDKSRQINAFEIDFDFPLFNILDRNLLLIGEISAIKFPETRYYKRVDDSQFTNDKKSRDGVWGLLFPGFKYTLNQYSVTLGFNYNSSIFSPYYFNNTYDFEKVRYREYNISQNEQNFFDESELLMSFSDDDTGQNIFIPKDLHAMINGYENTYHTYGFTALFERKINKKGHLNIGYSYFKELTNNMIKPLEFNDLLVDFSINKDFFSIPSELNFLISKAFFESSTISLLEENLMYGLTLKLNIYRNLFISAEFKDVFYDKDFDGDIDKISYINTGLKLKF
ncbi:hypothetical protein OAI93_02575 [bacterium]|nr:hypothetical protein [bacterium]